MIMNFAAISSTPHSGFKGDTKKNVPIRKLPGHFLFVLPVAARN
jgi:hypothetical protein